MRSSQHIWRILSCETYVMLILNKLRMEMPGLQRGVLGRRRVLDQQRLTHMLRVVKYLAYLRKMTRYNPTRGGKLFLLNYASQSQTTSRLMLTRRSF